MNNSNTYSLEEQGEDGKDTEANTGDTVRGKEGQIYLSKIIRTDQAVLIEQQTGKNEQGQDQQSDVCLEMVLDQPQTGSQAQEGNHVQEPGHPECFLPAQPGGNGV